MDLVRIRLAARLEEWGLLPGTAEESLAPEGQWHRRWMPHGTSHQTWRAVAAGTAQVVVGARSALFLPFRDLGLIIVDEEHETAFKQEEGVIYHARDMAVARAHLAGIPIVLVSATPSLETRVNAETGRYGHLKLESRYAGRSLPSLSAVDMRRDAPPRGRGRGQPVPARHPVHGGRDRDQDLGEVADTDLLGQVSTAAANYAIDVDDAAAAGGHRSMSELIADTEPAPEAALIAAGDSDRG